MYDMNANHKKCISTVPDNFIYTTLLHLDNILGDKLA